LYLFSAFDGSLLPLIDISPALIRAARGPERRFGLACYQLYGKSMSALFLPISARRASGA
jgi:hypothetical protein